MIAIIECVFNFFPMGVFDLQKKKKQKSLESITISSKLLEMKSKQVNGI